jgi:hypothetical protein
MPDKKSQMAVVAVGAVIFAGGAVGVGVVASHGSSAAHNTVQANAANERSPLPASTPGLGSSAAPQAPGRNVRTVGARSRGPATRKLQSGSKHSDARPSVAWPSQNTGAGSVHSPATPNTTPVAHSSPAPHRVTPTATSFSITGQVSCVSGNSVEGVWVQASRGSGFASWQGLGNGSTSDWWFTLPATESYSLHVGCGGSTASWKVATYSPTVSGGHNSFNCFDVAGAAGYGTCRLR